MPDAIVVSEGVWKTFRLPHDRPSTLKQRVLHPRQSRAATRLHALRDVSFEVADGEFFGIIGRNGSGKSTLLKCLAGIYRPDRGALEVRSRVSPFIELGVGFTPELTARDNVIVNAALLGMPAAEANARFPEIIRFAELEQFVDLKLKNYSSGMQVRLGFAAAIQADAEIYLVDEVLAVGDARFQEKCFRIFRQFKREGRTVIYVTHDLATTERFCDRAMWLEGGEVAALGDPHDVIGAYRRRDIELAQREAGESRRQTETRWGDGAAEIVDIWIEGPDGERVSVVPQSQPTAIVAKVRFKQTMDNPVLGTIVRGEGGEQLLVANTLLDGLSTGRFDPGDEALLTLRFDAHLGDGRYTVTLAVAHEDAQRFADWREDAAEFSVRAERYTGALVDLPHETRLERLSPSRPEPSATATS
jgi:ABC-2 type transport system ATP-binding protein